jgi:hypothetical protein
MTGPIRVPGRGQPDPAAERLASGFPDRRKGLERANPNPSPATRLKPGAEWRGNAAGRSGGRALLEVLRDALDETELDGAAIPDGDRVADLLVQAMIGHALRGNAARMREILDRVDGEVPATRPEAGPVRVEVVYADPDPDVEPRRGPGVGGAPIERLALGRAWRLLIGPAVFSRQPAA